MPNIRATKRNLADRATLTATSAASADFAVANLKDNDKFAPWRATGTYAAIKAVLAEQATVGFVGRPFCNESDTSLHRVRVSNEVSATNLLKYSEGFDQSTWNKSLGLLAQSGELAPDNTLTACRIISAGGQPIITQSVAATSTTMSLSVYTKKGTRSTGYFFIRNSTTSTNFVTGTFNYDTGTISGGGWAAVAVGNGWYRLTFTSATGISVGDSITAYLGANGGTTITQGEYWLLWGAMMNAGGISSYYPSVDSFTSRASTATYIGSDGLIKTAAINEERMQYNPDDLNAPPKLLLEAAATNVCKGSETFSTANGWASTLAVSDTAVTFRGVPYKKLAKTTTATSEGKGSAVWSGAAGSIYTYTIALRADTASSVSLGLYDSTNGTTWGLSSEVLVEKISGPATVVVAKVIGGMVNVTGLSATEDTLVRMTRMFNLAGSVSAYIYPGTYQSATIGDAILATRAQVETAQVMYSSEKITNGTFDTNTSGWASSPTLTSTAAAVSGEMQVSTTTAGGRQLQAVTVTVGKTYILTGTGRRVSGDGSASVGYSLNSNGTGITTAMSSATPTAVTGSVTFTATQATYYICAGDGSGSATSATYAFDNISVKEFNLIPVSTSYIPTANAAVTRSADVSSSAAGVRPAGYIDYWQSYDYDSGWVSARTVKPEVWHLTDAQAASAYGRGGGAFATHWLPKTTVRGVSVDIKDTANLQGYIEVGRLVVADYWEAKVNADYGTEVRPKDESKQERNSAGGQVVEPGALYNGLRLPLSKLDPDDRNELWKLLRASGKVSPLVVSLFPEDPDPVQENMHQVYGRLVETPGMNLPSYRLTSATIEIQEI